jgi:hypothetical protein
MTTKFTMIDELVPAAHDAEQARTLLLNITRALRNTMDRMPVEEDIMTEWVNAEIDLDNAIEQYLAMRNKWVPQSMWTNADRRRLRRKKKSASRKARSGKMANEPEEGLTAADAPFLEKMIRWCQGTYPEEEWDESFRERRTKHPEFGDKWLEKIPIHRQVIVWGGGWKIESGEPNLNWMICPSDKHY